MVFLSQKSGISPKPLFEDERGFVKPFFSSLFTVLFDTYGYFSIFLFFVPFFTRASVNRFSLSPAQAFTSQITYNITHFVPVWCTVPDLTVEFLSYRMSILTHSSLPPPSPHSILTMLVSAPGMKFPFDRSLVFAEDRIETTCLNPCLSDSVLKRETLKEFYQGEW